MTILRHLKLDTKFYIRFRQKGGSTKKLILIYVDVLGKLGCRKPNQSQIAGRNNFII